MRSEVTTSDFQFVINQSEIEKIRNYKERLARGESASGPLLDAMLQERRANTPEGIARLSLEEFIQALIDTKHEVVVGSQDELTSGGRARQKLFNDEERGYLASITFLAKSFFYRSGQNEIAGGGRQIARHGGYQAFVSAPALDEVAAPGGDIDYERYRNSLSGQILPSLIAISQAVQQEKKMILREGGVTTVEGKAVVTVPVLVLKAVQDDPAKSVILSGFFLAAIKEIVRNNIHLLPGIGRMVIDLPEALQPSPADAPLLSIAKPDGSLLEVKAKSREVGMCDRVERYAKPEEGINSQLYSIARIVDSNPRGILGGAGMWRNLGESDEANALASSDLLFAMGLCSQEQLGELESSGPANVIRDAGFKDRMLQHRLSTRGKIEVMAGRRDHKVVPMKDYEAIRSAAASPISPARASSAGGSATPISPHGAILPDSELFEQLYSTVSSRQEQSKYNHGFSTGGGGDYRYIEYRYIPRSDKPAIQRGPDGQARLVLQPEVVVRIGLNSERGLTLRKQQTSGFEFEGVEDIKVNTKFYQTPRDLPSLVQDLTNHYMGLIGDELVEIAARRGAPAATPATPSGAALPLVCDPYAILELGGKKLGAADGKNTITFSEAEAAVIAEHSVGEVGAALSKLCSANRELNTITTTISDVDKPAYQMMMNRAIGKAEGTFLSGQAGVQEKEFIIKFENPFFMERGKGK